MGIFGDSDDPTRRDVLRASGGAFGVLPLGGSGQGGFSGFDLSIPCPDVTLGSSTEHYDESGMENCADDHPETEEIRAAVKESLTTTYPTVGALLDAGYVPYFDFMAPQDDSGWSHWINPAFLDDDAVLDPERPESVLVDHKWWRPIGVMFLATRDGNRVERPPAVYGEDDSACLPWHAHTGLPGVKAWLKFWLAYGDLAADAIRDFPCRTPWGLHVWAYPHPDTTYAHGAPPRGNRGGPPAEEAGFETDAVPGEDPLGPRVLPDAVVHEFSELTEEVSWL